MFKKAPTNTDTIKIIFHILDFTLSVTRSIKQRKSRKKEGVTEVKPS